MAIAAGTSSRGASFATTNSLTWTGPTVSGANTIGLVLIGYRGTPTLTGVTWGGVAMTNVASATTADGANTRGVAVYYILNPGSAASVVVSASSNWTTLFACSCYFTGVNQATPIDTGMTNTAAASTTFAAGLTTTYANEYLVDTVVQIVSGATISASGSTTRMQNGNSGVGVTWGSGYNAAASAGANTLSWSSTSSTIWLQGVIALREAFQPSWAHGSNSVIGSGYVS